MIDVIKTTQWGARKINTSGLHRQEGLGITIHHTASANVRPLWPALLERQRCYRYARMIQADHRRRGWLDTGNHFFVFRSGLILEGRTGSLEAAKRGFVIPGAHAGYEFANERTWGIECEGLYSAVEMPADQWHSVASLCAHICYWSQVDTQQLFPHRHWKATECPGAWLAAHMPALRRAAHDRKVVLLRDGDGP